jgi:hypothetical protein
METIWKQNFGTVYGKLTIWDFIRSKEIPFLRKGLTCLRLRRATEFLSLYVVRPVISPGFLIRDIKLWASSELAIKQLFSGLSLEPTITRIGSLTQYSAPDIDIFVGDIFELNADILGTVHGIYDRAALVALPTDMRTRYARHLINITDRAPQFLICYEYDQSLMSGPPFSIDSAHIRDLYTNDYSVAPVDRIHVEGGLKGLNEAIETVTLLRGKP